MQHISKTVLSQVDVHMVGCGFENHCPLSTMLSVANGVRPTAPWIVTPPGEVGVVAAVNSVSSTPLPSVRLPWVVHMVAVGYVLRCQACGSSSRSYLNSVSLHVEWNISQKPACDKKMGEIKICNPCFVFICRAMLPQQLDGFWFLRYVYSLGEVCHGRNATYLERSSYMRDRRDAQPRVKQHEVELQVKWPAVSPV